MTRPTTDPVARYLRALAGVTAVVQAAPPDAWDLPSSCPDWTTRQLLGHLIDAQQQTVAMITGRGPRPPVSDPGSLAQLVGEDRHHTPVIVFPRREVELHEDVGHVLLDGPV